VDPGEKEGSEETPRHEQGVGSADYNGLFLNRNSISGGGCWSITKEGLENTNRFASSMISVRGGMHYLEIK